MSVWGFPCLKNGRRSCDRPRVDVGNSPAVVPLPPLHEIYFTGPCPGERSVTLIEAGLRLPGNLANRLRHRLDLDLFVPVLVIGPRLTLSPVESSDGTIP